MRENYICAATTDPPLATPAPSVRPFRPGSSSLAVGWCFLTMGFLVYSIMVRLPEIKADLGLGEQVLGLVLLGSSLGGYLASVSSGFVFKRLNTVQGTLASVLVLCLVVQLPALAVGAYSLFFFLLVMGLTDGFLNVGMNAAVTDLERSTHVRIMTSCHGMFSLGGTLGALLAGWLAEQQIPLHTHLLGVGLVLMATNIAQRKALLRIPVQPRSDDGPGFALPTPAMYGLSFICFSCSLAEGAVIDWTAIYFVEDLGSSALVAGYAVSVFSGAMTVCRFGGDRIRRLLQSKYILRIACGLTALGLALVAFSSSIPPGIVGLLLMGTGVSVVVPICYVLATEVPGVSSQFGIAAMAGMGILGFFLGPTYMGFVAEHYGLSTGYAGICLLLLAAFGLTYRLRQ